MPNPAPGGAKPTPEVDQAAANELADALKAMRATLTKMKTATEGADKQATELEKVK